MRATIIKAIAGFALAVAMSIPAWAAAQDTQNVDTRNTETRDTQRADTQEADTGDTGTRNADTRDTHTRDTRDRDTERIGRPGTINYVEGQASVGNKALSEKSGGSVELASGQVLTTQQDGKVEVLLTPGVLLRVGNNSALKMVSPSLSNTEVELDNGRAMIDAAQVLPDNRLIVDQGSATVELTKRGLYDFDAAQGQVRVFDGEAIVTEGGKHTKVKAGHEVNLTGLLKSRSFNRDQYAQDDLYRWSSLRSSYLAEANYNEAPYYANSEYFAPGWFWNSWYGCYTWLPGGGLFYSPFGWGFYSPAFFYGRPFFGFGFGYGYPYDYGYGYYGGRYYHRFGPGYRPGGYGVVRGGAIHSTTGVRGGFGGGAVHGGAMHGSSFGGGGFHGGGFGGGGHR